MRAIARWGLARAWRVGEVVVVALPMTVESTEKRDSIFWWLRIAFGVYCIVAVYPITHSNSVKMHVLTVYSWANNPGLSIAPRFFNVFTA